MQTRKKKKIVIFGGSFDPIHIGHAIVASYVSQLDGIDEVWLMVTPQNPMKEQQTRASFRQRMEMADLVAADCKKVFVSDYENKLPHPHFTIETLNSLAKNYPDCSFSLLVGADNIEIFHKWKDSDKILKQFGVIAYPRPGYRELTDSKEIRYISECPVCDISSSFIRKMISGGKDVRYLVPFRVWEYINKNGLYKL